MIHKKKIREEADRREALHEKHASSRPLSDDYEFTGLLGEAEFAERLGLEVDIRSLPGGDCGIDFNIPVAVTVDVKTSEKPPKWLLVENGKVRADIYVLARRHKDDSIELLGWARASYILRTPVKDYGNCGIMSYGVPLVDLCPMSSMYHSVRRAQELAPNITLK
ncbi:MAG TPA: hypothetical protein VFI02_14150 [Armatimonadota bacterium]|nr:hypothetical protein [Armatimonadota bacterium]